MQKRGKTRRRTKMGDKPYTHDKFLEDSKFYAAKVTNDNAGENVVHPEDIYVVWSCKTLQNSKALLASNQPDGLYFEATLDGDKNRIYFDTYKKVDNTVLTWG